MKIKINYLVEGSKDAEGLVVIIDVLRACTTIPILFSKGAKAIIPVRTPKEASNYEKKGFILVGEGEHGHKHDTFHHNNSPSEVINEIFNNKTIVLRSNNATQAILNANKAKEILLASFVNLDAVCDYIRKSNIALVTIVALGRLGERGLEDDLCAQAIKYKLEGKKINMNKIKKDVWDCDCSILVRKTLGLPEDVRIALKFNSFPIIPQVLDVGGIKTIKPIKL